MDGSAQQIGEIFDTLSQKAPKVISGLMQSMFSAESGRQMGQAAGAMYKELVAAGIPHEEAINMTKEYLTSLKNLAAGMLNDNRG